MTRRERRIRRKMLKHYHTTALPFDLAESDTETFVRGFTQGLVGGLTIMGLAVLAFWALP